MTIAGRASPPAETRRLEYDFHLDPFEDYLAFGRGLADRSTSAYRRDVGHFVFFASASGIRSPGEIKPRLLHDYAAQLSELGLDPSSIRRRQSALRAYFAYLVDEGVVSTNPTDKMIRPRLGRRLPDHLSQAEAARLVEAVQESSTVYWRDRAILELLYSTGMRVTELVGLLLRRLDLENGSCLILGKGGKERYAPIGRAALEGLRRYLRDVRPRLDKGRSRGRVFLNQRGGPLSRAWAWRIVRDAARRAGISRAVSPHTLRHTFATHMLEGGADLITVQEILGHAHIVTTEIYTHLDLTRLGAVHRNHHPRAR